MRYRTHLLIKRRRVACLQRIVYSASKKPAEVTCGKCQHTIHMADAEALAASKKRRKDRP